MRLRSLALPMLAALGAVVLALAAGSMRHDSATADEAAHIASGLIKLREGRLDFYRTQAPLTEAIAAFPLAVGGYRVSDEWRQFGNRPWVAGHILLYRSGYDAQRVLTLARLPVIVLFLCLGVAVFWFVRDVTGSVFWGLGAFILAGFCPTLLAHGRLATVDMGLTFFVFVACALFLRLLRKPSRGVALALGVAVACAIASKVSGVILVPWFGVVLGAWVYRTNRTNRTERTDRTAVIDVVPSGEGGMWVVGETQRGRDRWISLLIAAATSLLVFCAIYMALGRAFDPTFPFRELLNEVQAVRAFYAERHVLPQFLLGEFSADGWPHYYLVAIAVKTPLAALLLFCLIRTRSFEIFALLLFAALFLLVSAFSSLNLGIRHILPIYPFLYAAVAISLADARLRLRFLGALLVFAHALTGLFAYPSYISYFNPLIGSHRNADRVLIDSNLDWGQDLVRLRRWAEQNNVQRLRVHYFGAGNVERELGPRGERWSALRPQPLPQGWFAVSRHFYRLSFHPRARMNYDTYLALSKAHYVRTVGGSIDIYRVD
ncbi:MAG TPA: phospholipid carrier-dependent glycosyltransferase [Thermoanaerobaculia bacterium]|nr:phospholipid carrier-dependent glycosyltransferase [Thermoanaerobaculia bacterium]